MKTKILSCLSILLISFAWANAQSFQPIELTAEYGPPSAPDTFELFTIPITPESFNVDAATLISALENITSFKIKTEMHTGNDIGGVDNIVVGSVYASYFDNSQEGWSSGGDGTLEWKPEGGFSGGYIQISDWATGDWHWVIAPISWTGDWSDLFGESISFYYKTNKPTYNAVIVLTNEVVNRLVLNTTVNTVPLDDSTKIKLEVTPVPAEDLSVNIGSSNTECLTAPSTVIIPSGHEFIEFYVSAAAGASIDCESVIEATSSGYQTSRITMQTVEDNSGIPQLNDQILINIYPNPGSDIVHFRVTRHASQVTSIDLYSISGIRIESLINELKMPGAYEVEIDVSDLPGGLYMIRWKVGDEIRIRKLAVVH